jgi:hypothetical protein
MDSRLKMVGKLLDRYIISKYDDIMEYTLRYDEDGNIEIVFWMDGTEQEVEEEIVDECYIVLTIVKPKNNYFIFKFTTEGEHFYTYK